MNYLDEMEDMVYNRHILWFEPAEIKECRDRYVEVRDRIVKRLGDVFG